MYCLLFKKVVQVRLLQTVLPLLNEQTTKHLKMNVTAKW